FKIAFVIFAAFVSAKMLIGRNWSLGVSLPGRLAQRGFGFLTGLVSSLVGVSGGSISNAALTLYGKPIHQAVATSAGIGVPITIVGTARSEEHTSELQSPYDLVCRLLLEKKKTKTNKHYNTTKHKFK